MAGLFMEGMVASAACFGTITVIALLIVAVACVVFVVCRILLEAVYRIDWFISYSGREPEDGQEVEE